MQTLMLRMQTLMLTYVNSYAPRMQTLMLRHARRMHALSLMLDVWMVFVFVADADPGRMQPERRDHRPALGLR